MASKLGSQVEARLRELYPDGRIPYGGQTALARELSCTSEYVRQVANRLGMANVPTERPGLTCRNCGQPREAWATYCTGCQWVPLVCATCGITFLRERANVLFKTRHGGGFADKADYCSRRCMSLSRPDPLGLRRRRVDAGLGLQEAARRLGVSRTQLNEVERGRRHLSPELERRMDGVYGA